MRKIGLILLFLVFTTCRIHAEEAIDASTIDSKNNKGYFAGGKVLENKMARKTAKTVKVKGRIIEAIDAP
ncbi:secreted protein [Candidatus Omnitrophus magneticus]|uniref:Secreted protein n=1 Tax=Candidatus Omnitrophus magneticus TaxID=1609969 RepID=A0A0F0CKT4_9BACT|nr:secreted protein [Candidatus Omnitrophus magneticus]